MQLEALVRQFHNSDMKPAKHAANARRQVRVGSVHLILYCKDHAAVNAPPTPTECGGMYFCSALRLVCRRCGKVGGPPIKRKPPSRLKERM